MITTTTTDTTTTLTQQQKDQYRFGGVRYQFQGPAKYANSHMVLKEIGAYTYPKEDEVSEDKET